MGASDSKVTALPTGTVPTGTVPLTVNATTATAAPQSNINWYIILFIVAVFVAIMLKGPLIINNGGARPIGNPVTLTGGTQFG